MELETGENAIQIATNKTKEEPKWVSHYSNAQKLLLVGEGDFSFSSCLATAFGTANHIVATSLDSPSDLQQKYGKDAFTNITNLVKRGAHMFHEFDACHMLTKHATPLCKLQQACFDRIIFNFPHAGFPASNAEDATIMTRKHKELIRGFFANASSMLLPGGEVHVSHKQGEAYDEWKLEEHALTAGLRLVKCTPFVFESFPGYRTRRGAAKEASKRFPLRQAATYIFSQTLNPKPPLTLMMQNEPEPQNRSNPKTAPLLLAKSRLSDMAELMQLFENAKESKISTSESSSLPSATCHGKMTTTEEDYDYGAILLRIAKLGKKGRVCEETSVVQVMADEVSRLEKTEMQLGKKKMVELKLLKVVLKDSKIAVLEEEDEEEEGFGLFDVGLEIPICLRVCEFCGAEFRKNFKRQR